MRVSLRTHRTRPEDLRQQIQALATHYKCVWLSVKLNAKFHSRVIL